MSDHVTYWKADRLGYGYCPGCWNEIKADEEGVEYTPDPWDRCERCLFRPVRRPEPEQPGAA